MTERFTAVRFTIPDDGGEVRVPLPLDAYALELASGPTLCCHYQDTNNGQLEARELTCVPLGGGFNSAGLKHLGVLHVYGALWSIWVRT